jgi:hypothetical protein
MARTRLHERKYTPSVSHEQARDAVAGLVATLVQQVNRDPVALERVESRADVSVNDQVGATVPLLWASCRCGLPRPSDLQLTAALLA